jgi:CBS domain-containing protein
MRGKEAMTKTVHSISPDRPLSEASELMERFGISHVIVVERGKAVGVLTDGDLIRHPAATIVRSVMSRDVVTIDEDELISRAANMMRDRSIKCLVVTKEEKLAGVITSTDLLEIVARTGHTERMVLRDRGAKHHRHPHTQ